MGTTPRRPEQAGQPPLLSPRQRRSVPALTPPTRRAAGQSPGLRAAAHPVRYSLPAWRLPPFSNSLFRTRPEPSPWAIVARPARAGSTFRHRPLGCVSGDGRRGLASGLGGRGLGQSCSAPCGMAGGGAGRSSHGVRAGTLQRSGGCRGARPGRVDSARILLKAAGVLAGAPAWVGAHAGAVSARRLRPRQRRSRQRAGRGGTRWATRGAARSRSRWGAARRASSG